MNELIMGIENVTIHTPDNAGDYFVNETTGEVDISYKNGDQYGIANVEKCFPTTELLEAEKNELKSYRDTGYTLLGECDENGDIPENLQHLLDSESIVDYHTINRKTPNKDMIIGKVTFKPKENKLEKIVNDLIFSILK